MEPLKELALTVALPPGFEIDENIRRNQGAFMDVRDDRVYYYFDLPANTKSHNKKEPYKKTFTLPFHVSYVGTYYMPATLLEAMYDNTISARVKGRWIKVTPTVSLVKH